MLFGQFDYVAGEPSVHEPTVEQLMEMGYYSKGEPARGHEQGIVQTQTNFELAPVSSTTNSLSDRWSPEKISQKDRVLGEEAEQAKRQKSLRSTVIRTEYRPTTVQADGSRRYGPRTLSSHTVPKSSPTRKGMLHDAAAGQCIIDRFQQDEQRGTGAGRVPTATAGFDVEDLISFE
jgi:hypothetical protein